VPPAPLVPIAGATLQVEIVTAAGIVPSSEGDRPMILLVCVGDRLALFDVVGKLPADAGGVAAHVAGWLRPTFTQHGRPRQIDVRRADVAAALGDALAAEHVPVRVKPRPRVIAQMILELREELDMPEIINLPAMPFTWGAWDAPEPILTAAVEASAAYYRAAPWTLIDDRLRVTLTTASGATWSLLVLGGGGEVMGLAMFDYIADAELFAGARDDEFDETSPLDRLTGGIVQVDFNPEADLPSPMRREFRLRRWPAAGPLAWPVVTAANTLGGALTPVQLVDLTDALTSLARLVSSDPDAVFEVERTGAPMAWRDDVSGAALVFEARFTGAERPWAAPVALSPCLPSGPGAEPAAVLAKPVHEDLVADGTAVVERFRDWLAARPRQRRTADRHGANAELFVVLYLSDVQGIPVRAVTEYNLRAFLYDHLPRKVLQSRREALETLTSLRLLFQFLAEEEGIHAPWAAETLAEKDALAVRLDTCPGNFFFDIGIGRWRLAGDNDLFRRLLLNDGWLAPGVRFGHAIAEGYTGMGADEAMIERELQRRWLIWRDELLAGASAQAEAEADGGAAPALSAYRILLALKERRDLWARQAQPALGKQSPLQVVKAERKAARRRFGRGGRAAGRGGHGGRKGRG